MNRLNVSELYEIADEMEELLGTKELLDSLLKQMSIHELKESLEYIDRMHDTNLFD